MTVTVIASDWQKWFPNDLSGYYAWNNVWGKGDFANGRDYFQTITVDDASFPNGTKMAWHWPDERGPEWCYGYPEIYYVPPFPVKIKDLKKCVVDYMFSIRGNFNAYDVLFDIWPSIDPEGKQQVAEIAFYPFWPSLLYNRGVVHHFVKSTPKFHAQIYTGVAGDGKTPGTCINPCEPIKNPTLLFLLGLLSKLHMGYRTPVHILSGSVDILEILQYLVSKKTISGDWYISNLQLGVEPQCSNIANGNSLPHAGSVIINKLSYTYE